MLDSPAPAGEPANGLAADLANFTSDVRVNIRRMAKLLRRNQRQGQATTFSDLRAAGFTQSQIGALFPDARRIADRYTFRQDDFETALRAEIEELERAPLTSDDTLLARAADLATGLMPSEAEVFAALRRGGFELETVTRLWPRIVERLGQHVATGALPKTQVA